MPQTIEDLDLTPPDELPDLATWLARNFKIILDAQVASGSVDSVFGRSGDVVALLADYDSFFLTQAEADALYSVLAHTHASFDTHIADGTIHFTEASIGITESQITDFQTYLLASAKAADSELLDGVDGSDYAIKANNESITGEWDFTANSHVVRRDKSSGITVAGAGWYQVAKATGSVGRGSFDLHMYTSGGSHVPQFLRIVGHKNWSTAGYFDQIYSSANTWWTGVRIVDDTAAGDTYVEVNFTQALSSNLFLWGKDAAFLDKFVTQSGALTVHDSGHTVRLTQNLSSNNLHISNLVVININPSGTVDGRDIDADGTKLDTIETDAKDDQTAVEIEAIVSHDNLVDFLSTEHFLQSAISITLNQVSDSGALAALNSVGLGDVNTDSITFVELQPIGPDTLVGRVGPIIGDAIDLPVATVRTMLNVEDGAQVNVGATGDLKVDLTEDWLTMDASAAKIADVVDGQITGITF